MPNGTNNRNLIDLLKNDHSTELMPHDLNEMLDHELSKPADEIDTQLVQDLLDLLDEETPSQESKDECWKAIQSHTQKKRSNDRSAILRRLCTVAAALILVFFASFGTAKAFDWTFLLKFLSPVAETFGIYSANNPINHADTNNTYQYTDEEILIEQVNFTDLKDMPTQLKGYPIVPEWIPERYTFATGSIFEDTNVVIASLFFRNGDEFLSLSTSFYENDEDATAYVYEAYTEDKHNMHVSDQSVTFYYNDSGEICAASTISQNAHIYIGGSISESELRQIIDSMY